MMPAIQRLIPILLLALVIHPGTGYSQSILDSSFTSSQNGVGLHWGILDLNLTTGSIRYEHQSDHQFAPASLLKLISTAFLLEHFPDSFIRSTRLGYDGLIVNDTLLYGNLILKAAGDPLFGAESAGGSRDLSKACLQLRKNKIRAIRGTIIIDYSGLPEIQTNLYSTQEDQQWWYGAPSCGISYHQNYLDLMLERDRDSIRVVLTPSLFDCSIRSMIRQGLQPSPIVNVYLNDNLREIVLDGSFPQSLSNYRIKLAVSNPPLFMASVLKQKLLEFGIIHQGKIKWIHPNESIALTDYREISVFPGSNLMKILEIANRESSNFIFDQLVSLYDHFKSNSSGLNHLNEYVEHRLGLEDSRFMIHLLDYSGLSPYNSITPSVMGQFIRTIHQQPDLWKKLIETLPRAAEIEAFKTLLPDSAVIKTGTLKNSCSLFALIRQNGQERVFLGWVERIPEGESMVYFKQMADYINRNPAKP
ncbi:MAG: D-alanyl-D-alanine carboxypeptidase [Candidatus Delongbacteria bacterium]|nr:D-alanyl-D-alanine carboxypeptidase [Candidatus Delongbacteria bacterium]